MSSKHPSGAPWRNFYGRFKGKTLRPAQETYLEEDLAALSPGAVGWDENPDRNPLDLNALFGGRDLWVEIGFGGGEHLVHQAERNPGVGIIGAEPFINGVAMLLGKIRKAKVDNLRVHHAKVVKAWLAEHKDEIEVFYLPSYSPELNPDEYMNCDLKAGVHGGLFACW